MKQTHGNHILQFIIAALLFAALTGCTGTQVAPIEGAEREQALAQVEPIADNLFQGMRERDYTAFARDFDPAMQKAMDEKRFLQMLETIDPVIGQYQSRQVAKVEKAGQYVAVTYTVRYELEDAVSWRIVLAPGDSPQVSGLWYDSPKLRGTK